MIQFKGFKPEAEERIARTMGYSGDMGGFATYLAQNPEKQNIMNNYRNMAMNMVKGGVVSKAKNMQVGGAVAPFDYYLPGVYGPDDPQREVNPKYTGGMENVYETPTPEVPDIKKLDLSAFQPSVSSTSSTLPQQPSMKFSAGDNLEDLYYTDYDNPRSDDELRAMYAVAQADAKAKRDAGFMGRMVLPGEMSFKDYAENNRYQILPKDQGRPPVSSNKPEDSFDANAIGNVASTIIGGGSGASGGTFVPMPQLPIDVDSSQSTSTATPLQDQMAEQAYNPELPYGGAVYAQGIGLQPQQFIPSGSGQLQGQVSADAVQADTFQAKAPTPTGPAQYDATQVSGAMAQQTAGVQAAQADGLAPEATVSAATQTDSMVSQVTAAQGTGILMDNPAQRKVQSGELVSGAADAQTAAKFTEQVQAAQATPSKQATVQGQLEGLLQQFEGGATPAWAAGAMRAATATMAARGLGASSMAGQAVVQAAMESALPVAQADAATRAAFEAQNLSNRQERAMLAAQQRAAFIGMEFDQAFQSRVMNASKVSDIANMNFTAEQQVALENSRIANTINLQNLNNQQAVVMAEAAALSQLDMANLNNRQQAAVMNAQSFLSMDMANLNNRQQVAMFKAQAMQQALFTDQAAANAAKQFNATSQMQTDQFFANLQTQTSQFNAAQANAQAQFNAGEENVISRFNTELRNQREQFNAKNRLIIDQNNVQWRREVATANTAAINRANEINAKSILDMSETAYNNLWQYYSDSMEYAWTSAENERDRLNKLAQIKLQGDIKADITDLQNDYNSSVAFGNLIGTFLTGGFKTFGNLFGGGS